MISTTIISLWKDDYVHMWSHAPREYRDICILLTFTTWTFTIFLSKAQHWFPSLCTFFNRASHTTFPLTLIKWSIKDRKWSELYHKNMSCVLRVTRFSSAHGCTDSNCHQGFHHQNESSAWKAPAPECPGPPEWTPASPRSKRWTLKQESPLEEPPMLITY